MPVEADVLLSDDFESYNIGTFPSSGGWEPHYNIVGDPGNNIVTNITSYSDGKCLQLYGAHSGCWAAETGHLVSLPSVFYIECAMKASGDMFTSGSCHYWDIALGLAKAYYGSGCIWTNLLMFHKSGNILGTSAFIQPLVVNTWYKIKIKVDMDNHTACYWINDEYKGCQTNPELTSPGTYPYLTLSSGSGKGWIDDVRIATAIIQDVRLWCINSDGCGLKKLSEFNSWSPTVWAPPIFSPDGQQILFIKEYPTPQDRSELWKVNVDGTGLIQLTDPGPQRYGHEWPCDWSPDGSKISFRSERSNHNGWFEVWTMNASGLNQQNFGESNGLHASFSPDGSRIAYGKWYEGQLRIMNVDGSNKHTIRQCQRSHAPRTICWTKTNKIIFEDNPVPDNEDIYCINPDGTGLFPLVVRPGNDRFYDGDAELAISPDGSKLVFYSNANGNYDIYTVNMDGTNIQQLTTDPGADKEPLFSPDGSKIIWISEASGTKSLWIMNADGTDKRQLTDDSGEEYEFAVGPAGPGLFRIAFYSSRPTAMPAGGIISGTVTEPGGLQPIANATVELFDQDNDSVSIDLDNSDGDNDEFTLHTDTEGKYTIRNLSAGTYELKCWADRNGYTGKDSVEGIQLQLGETKDGVDCRIPKIIPVPYYEQGKTDWCAIASLSMLLSYNKVLVKPWQVACYFNKPPELGIRPGADLSLMEQYVETFGLSCESRYPLWESFDVIRENIIGYLERHIPVLFGSDKIKHAFVIAGYDDYSFYVHDPSEKISAEILSTPLISPVAVGVPFDIFESRIWGYTIGEFTGYLVVDPGSTSHSNGPSTYIYETSGPCCRDNFYYSNHLAFKDSEQPFQGNHILLSLDGTAQPYGYCYRDFTGLHPLSPPETGLLRAATTSDILHFDFVVANPFAHPTAISCYATITEDGLTEPVHFFPQQEMNLPAYSPETPYANVFSVSELTPGRMYTLAAHLTTTGGDAVDICFFNFYVLQSSDDFDSDGLSNDIEIATGTDPYDDDTDDDGLLDGPGSGEDLNANGVVDAGETDPRNPDTDGDGILDGTEKGLSSPEGNGTDLNVFVPDSDPSTTTDPTNADTDGDGIPDGQEDINKNGRVDPGELSPNIFDFACDIDIDPNTLNLGSGGRWVTCYIELPHQCDPHDIDISTIKLNDSVHAETTPASIGNYDADSILDLMVKFNRSAVGSILIPGDSVQIMVRGRIQGRMFFGFDTIRVIGTQNPRVIAGGSVNVPENFLLVQNYPNPFNPQTTIEFQISKPCDVTLEIFNMLGQKVAELVNEHKDSGYYAVVWNGKDDNGTDVANGIYFYRIKAGEFSDVKKMVLLR
jgi:WD40 repeat protein